jgi:hypothetical protein
MIKLSAFLFETGKSSEDYLKFLPQKFQEESEKLFNFLASRDASLDQKIILMFDPDSITDAEYGPAYSKKVNLQKIEKKLAILIRNVIPEGYLYSPYASVQFPVVKVNTDFDTNVKLRSSIIFENENFKVYVTIDSTGILTDNIFLKADTFDSAFENKINLTIANLIEKLRRDAHEDTIPF